MHMANPQDVIADAFGKLQRSVSEEDAHKFASTELKDVWAAVREIDSRQRMRLSAQNMRRIEPMLRGIEKYTKVIEVLCNGTPYMPYVWAPVKLMLEIASHHRDVFEALLTAYAAIGDALPRFDRYRETFANNIEFQHVLASVYTTILDFHQRAYKFFRRRAWHVIFLSLWKDFGSRFDSIIETLKKQRDFVDIEAMSFDMVEGKESRIRVQDDIRQRQKRDLEMLEENEKNARISQSQHCHAWLSMDDKIQEAVYERTSTRRHDTTCEWMLNEPYLKSWLKDDARRPCLWLEGKPGAGKSVMCSYIVQTLTKTPGLTVCYYFCNSQDTGNVCHQILTTVVLQILRQHRDLCTLVANEFVYNGASCGMAQLRILVPQLLEITSYTRIVIDGIDECSQESQKAILKELEALCKGSTTRCKVLFSSRREVHIYKKLSEHPQISLDGRQEVDWDIRSFVKYKITKLRTSDQDLLDKIETILVERANGMFLWVRLVVDELKYCYSDAALEETATKLPKGLKAAYGRILDRIMDPSNPTNARCMAIRILEWMACSYRTLKSYELLDGITIDLSNTTLTPKTKVRKEILDLCRPLVEEGAAGAVDFVHFSAKEYILEGDYQAGLPFICRENAHLDITFSCVAVLNSCVSLFPDNSTDAQRAAIIVRGFHGLLIYSDMFWYRHLLTYCSLLNQRKGQFNVDLLAQLQLLLKFRKDDSGVLPSRPKAPKEKEGASDPALEALNHLPDVKSLVSHNLVFRAKMAQEGASDKSPKEISSDSCDVDPTHFSAVRHHYQHTTELLLDDIAEVTYPSINKKDLQVFRDTSDGFESSLRRAKHESQHQRRFRCAHSSCVHFVRGFVSRNILNKHNENYHSNIVDGPSLAESLAPSPARAHTTSDEFRDQTITMPPRQIRGPTPQEILNIRNHPSGTMAVATDEQIRNLFIRNQKAQMDQSRGLTPQQQQQIDMQRQMQMQAQRQQALAFQMQQQQRMTELKRSPHAAIEKDRETLEQLTMKQKQEQQQQRQLTLSRDADVSNARLNPALVNPAHNGIEGQMQANREPPGGLTAIMFANIGREQQQRLAALPPEKLTEVVYKWHEQRQLQTQAARPQMATQQEPGQVPAGSQMLDVGQINPQNGANQFSTPNSSQQAPQNMAVGMNAQQKLMVQRQINAMRQNQNPIQQRAPRQAMNPSEHYEIAKGNSPLTSEQRNTMLNLIANPASTPGSNNALVRPAPAEPPTLEEMGYTQAEIDDLVRLQAEQDARIRDITQNLARDHPKSINSEPATNGQQMEPVSNTSVVLPPVTLEGKSFSQEKVEHLFNNLFDNDFRSPVLGGETNSSGPVGYPKAGPISPSYSRGAPDNKAGPPPPFQTPQPPRQSLPSIHQPLSNGPMLNTRGPTFYVPPKPLNGSSIIADNEQLVSPAGSSSAAIDSSLYDGLDFGNEQFAASPYSQNPHFSRFDFSSIDQPADTTPSSSSNMFGGLEGDDFGLGYNSRNESTDQAGYIPSPSTFSSASKAGPVSQEPFRTHHPAGPQEGQWYENVAYQPPAEVISHIQASPQTQLFNDPWVRSPFTSNGPTPPILQTESRRDMLAWAPQEAPFTSQALSHQPHQMQRSMSQSQRKPDLEQVLKAPLSDRDDPSEFIFRVLASPTVSVSPSVPT